MSMFMHASVLNAFKDLFVVLFLSEQTHNPQRETTENPNTTKKNSVNNGASDGVTVVKARITRMLNCKCVLSRKPRIFTTAHSCCYGYLVGQECRNTGAFKHLKLYRLTKIPFQADF